jgi:hypothetical protein
MAKGKSGRQGVPPGEPNTSTPENRRQSTMSAGGTTGKLSLAAKVFKRYSTSSADLAKDVPPPVLEGGRQLSKKASKLLGVQDPPSPPPPQVASPPTPRRPMAERYVSRRFRSDLQSIVQRESYHTPHNKKKPMGYMQLRHQFNSSFSGPVDEDDNALSSIMLSGLKKPHLCDVKMIGKDGVTIRAPSFLLSAHSRVLDEMLFSKPEEAAAPTKEEDSEHDHFEDAQDTLAEVENDDGKTIRVPFATQDAIQTALHLMASHELPLSRIEDSSEENVRTLTQVNVIMLFYKVRFLADEVYRAVRVLVNKKSNLASVVFDECNASMKIAGLDDKPKRNELLTYVFDSIREKPGESLIDGGLRYLSPDSIQKVICDQKIDVDEITMFHILFSWTQVGPGSKEDRIDVAKGLVVNVQLTLLDAKYLNSRVRYCGFVDASAVNDAIKEIEDHLANLSPEEQEHVVVTGAGIDAVNGMYVRMEEDIGLEDEEAVFIKEASEDEIGGDYGLYLWRDSWAISPCVDYSNILYSHQSETASKGWNRLKPPAEDWRAESGKAPAPVCEWKAAAAAEEPKEGANYLAPRLSIHQNAFDVKKLTSSIQDIDDGDHAEKKELNLDDMLNLPTDQDFEDDDYRDVRPRLLRSDPSFQRKSKLRNHSRGASDHR